MNVSAFEIAARGMAAQRAEMDVIAQNIAYAGARPPEGSGHHAQRGMIEPAADASFAMVLGDAIDAAGANDDFSLSGFGDASGLSDDPLPPGFGERAGAASRGAWADADDPIEQMVSLVAAGRAYDADVAVLQAAKQMEVEAIEVDRA